MNYISYDTNKGSLENYCEICIIINTTNSVLINTAYFTVETKTMLNFVTVMLHKTTLL